MSAKKLQQPPERQEYKWPPCLGDFAMLKEYYAEKERPFWRLLQLLDALLRGFGQVVFANNPLGGVLIAVTLAVVEPGAFALSAATGVLGLLLSVLMRDSQDNVENGLTVYNPLLVGVISYALIPQIYGAFDAFGFLHVLLGTIFSGALNKLLVNVFSVYLTRSLGSDKFPCTTWPFNLAELALIFALSTWNATDAVTDSVEPMFEMMVRAIVVSPSQVFAVNNIMFGSIVYLAILLFSPTTAVFSFLGALIGSLIGLQLGVKYDEIYNGSWGYNSLLTGAALGGNLLVLNGQTTIATIVAIVYTSLVQYSMQPIFKKMGLPMLSLPFVIAVSLFLKLRSNKDDATFPQPKSASFPEKQRHDYLVYRLALIQADDALEELDLAIQK